MSKNPQDLYRQVVIETIGASVAAGEPVETVAVCLPHIIQSMYLLARDHNFWLVTVRYEDGLLYMAPAPTIQLRVGLRAKSKT